MFIYMTSAISRTIASTAILAECGVCEFGYCLIRDEIGRECLSTNSGKEYSPSQHRVIKSKQSLR
jgi:hypothetical protein